MERQALELDTQNVFKGAGKVISVTYLAKEAGAILNISKELDAAKLAQSIKHVGSLSAEEANKKFTEKFLAQNPHAKLSDVRLPYASGTRAREIVLNKDQKFVRVHRDKQAGEWIMRPEEFSKLRIEAVETKVSLQDLLKDRFALPQAPSHISEVYVPAGTRMRAGTAAPQEGWSKGGGLQYEMEKKLADELYKGQTPISEYIKRMDVNP